MVLTLIQMTYFLMTHILMSFRKIILTMNQFIEIQKQPLLGGLICSSYSQDKGLLYRSQWGIPCNAVNMTANFYYRKNEPIAPYAPDIDLERVEAYANTNFRNYTNPDYLHVDFLRVDQLDVIIDGQKI